MEIKDFKDAIVTVMGLGRFTQGSGVGATKWLLRHGAQVIITDLKTASELKESVDEVTKWYEQYRVDFPDREIYHPIFVLGEHRAQDFTDVQAVLQNPDVRRESEFVTLAREHHVPIFSDVSLFFKFCPYKITAVTGTRGKTTTTALIGEMYKAVDPRAVTAGNIKVSPLESLDEILADKTPRPIVLELSSTLLESLDEVDRGADIAVMTNVYPDHLNRYDTYEKYRTSKELIFRDQTPDQKLVLNFDNEDVRAMALRAKSKLYWFSLQPLPAGKQGACIKDGQIIFSDEKILAVSEVKLEGEHNLSNALAAVCAARLSNVPTEKIVQVLKTFAGVEYRQEILRVINGVTYVNDTTATSPDGAVAALKRFGPKGKIILLAGGATKNLSFDVMIAPMRQFCKQIILFEGTATDELEKAIGSSIPSMQVKSMAQAVSVAVELAKDGDYVLLSPGCASFGMFKNEFDRGDQFREEVGKIRL